MSNIKLAGHKILSAHSIDRVDLGQQAARPATRLVSMLHYHNHQSNAECRMRHLNTSACLVVYFACCNSAGTSTSSADILTDSCALTISSFGEGDIARKMLAFDDSSTKCAVAAPNFSVNDRSTERMSEVSLPSQFSSVLFEVCLLRAVRTKWHDFTRS